MSATNEQQKEVLLVTDSQFVQTMAECWVRASETRLKVLPKKEFHRLEMRAIENYKRVIFDSNDQRDLTRYRALFQKIPQITVLGAYDFPVKAALSGLKVDFKIKPQGLRGIFEAA